MMRRNRGIDLEFAVQRIGLVVIPDFHVVSLVALSVFEMANLSTGRPLYDVHVISEDGGMVVSSMGIEVTTTPLDHASFDTVIVGAGVEVHPTTPKLVAFLQKAAVSTRRVASVCLGAFALGDAGLLDGRHATTHWAQTGELQRRFPAAIVNPDHIYTEDGPIWTSAGMAAGSDLALGMMERDLGGKITRDVARTMVLDRRRSGGQSQHSVLLDLDPKSDRIQNALVYARTNMSAPLTVGALAEAAHLSPRQFTRLFRAETGQSPAKAVEGLRLEAARLMAEQTSLPIETIVRDTGFGDRERMRRAFLRKFGHSPQTLRGRARQVII
jgi:transcriptional regulator GlxA family with amidase domain